MRTILCLAVAVLMVTSLTACADEEDDPTPATQGQSGLHVEEDPPPTATQEPRLKRIMYLDWVESYSDLGSLHAAADLVVQGVAKQLLATISDATLSDEHQGPTDGGFYSIYALEVEQVLKGVPSDSVIAILQTGGTTDWGTQEITDDPLFVVGERYILFLAEDEFTYHVRGGPQGRFVVRDNQVSSLDSIYPERNIMLAKHLRVRDMPLTEFHAALESPPPAPSVSPPADPGSN